MNKHHIALQKNVDDLLSKPDVYAVGLGEKMSKGKRTGKRALICSIKKKKPLAQLTREDMIPSEIDGIPTDIVEIGDRPRAFPAERERQRPVVPGISAGHIDITAGTIGGVVEVDGQTMLLSNNHVFANENEANLGDKIIQPGDYDGGSVLDGIGILYNYVPLTFVTQTEPTPNPTWPDDPIPDPEPPTPDPEPEPEPEPPVEEDDSDCFVANLFAKVLNKGAELLGRETRLKAVRPKKFDSSKFDASPQNVTAQLIRNRVDAALCKLDDDIEVNLNYLDYYGGVTGINELAGVGTLVKKLGRTTGFTNGIITQTNVVVDVQYDGGIVRFEDQISIEHVELGKSFSAGGDSGSIIVDENDNAIGLLFAGNDVTTFANSIDNVMADMNITKFTGTE